MEDGRRSEQRPPVENKTDSCQIKSLDNLKREKEGRVIRREEKVSVLLHSIPEQIADCETELSALKYGLNELVMFVTSDSQK